MKNKNKCLYSVSVLTSMQKKDAYDRAIYGVEECSGGKGKVIPFKDVPTAEKWRIRMTRSQLTNKQKEALKKVINRYEAEPDFEQDYGEYYGVKYGDLFIGIEEDGYTHT